MDINYLYMFVVSVFFIGSEIMPFIPKKYVEANGLLQAVVNICKLFLQKMGKSAPNVPSSNPV